MDPETEHIVDLSLKALDTEIKHAPIRRLASRIFRRKSDPSPVNQTHHREEAVQAALESAVERISRQELTMEQAFQIVGRVVTFDDLEKLNSTWQGHWSEGASKVGIEDEERRTWWARLLAGEIQQPGTFSLRTMAVMDTLSTGAVRPLGGMAAGGGQLSCSLGCVVMYGIRRIPTWYCPRMRGGIGNLISPKQQYWKA